ncbi:MAG: YegS/Rv2252/BmrU family lipid kinase [Bacilli bacterium]|nr:YegS/Rv2252/BmrU family lipid kinase [Bacilli bacterium]MDD4077005.1 YegS/Rv2252/BmrU family lipid kinase [Bacilli bacterium]MDD4387950.1 YegS/Rv2252/BmrU family lipid kinase [Bacilli bacterium]
MKHIFVINPVAGKKDSTAEIKEAINKTLHSEDCVIYITKKSMDACNFVRDYAADHQDEELRFYACGGDGTLNEVVNGACGFPNVAVGCYPVGSGNDFIKYFGEKKDFLDIKEQVNGQIVEVDLLKFSDRYVINILNIGFDADAANRMIKYKRLPLVSGKGAYHLGVVVSLLSKMSHYFKISLDGELIYEGDGLLCAIANGICYGGGYYCAPDAVVDDGLLDICFVRRISRPKFIGLIKYYKNGTHLITPKVARYIIYRKGREVVIECPKPLNYAIDGEMGKAHKIAIKVEPKALKFIIPAGISQKSVNA